MFACGRLIKAVINFLIIAIVVFMLVKAVHKTKRAEEEAPAEDPGPGEIDLLKEIAAPLKKWRPLQSSGCGRGNCSGRSRFWPGRDNIEKTGPEPDKLLT